MLNFRKVKGKAKVVKGHLSYLPEEVADLLHKTKDNLKLNLIISLLLDCAGRIQDLFHMTWEQFYIQDGIGFMKLPPLKTWKAGVGVLEEETVKLLA